MNAAAVETASIVNSVRDVTDDEIASYKKNGWVMLKQLIPASVVRELLQPANALMERTLATLAAENKRVFDGIPRYERVGNLFSDVKDYPDGSQDVNLKQVSEEPFRSLKLSKQMGRVAGRLMDRERLSDAVGIQYHRDYLWRKFSKGREASNSVYYHQDAVGYDRTGYLMIWIALDEVKPEQGSLQFLSGSHREGPLGYYLDMAKANPAAPNKVLDQYPKLLDLYERTPPMHYQPGDATVHDGFAIHGSAPNTTATSRWSYVCAYKAADLRWLGDVAAGETADWQEPQPVVYP